VRKLTSIAVVVMIVSAFGGGMSAQNAAPALPQIAAVSYPDSPLTITASRILSVRSPAAVAFEVTNITNRSIGDYDVRVYAYRANGRPIGFRSVRQRADLRPGTEHADLVSLGEWILEPGTVVLITITGATFADETVWRVPLQDAQDRVKAEAARLIGVSGV
jgi:hypothetical protein